MTGRMEIFDLLTMTGGLALFLYGMHLMGEGLSKASGRRLERILEKLTNSPVRAVLVGAGATAILQSSSTATVMVVGFVNSGIMRLPQATGVIMGANIGTTVTSWLLSLTGIDSQATWIRLLQPSAFSPVMAMAGVMLLMFSKSEGKRNIATALMGGAILMFGMNTMCNAVMPLTEMPELAGVFAYFSHPIWGMLMGLILTAILQSSSASVGILQALCATGEVSYGTAVPIILGQNIGTCVTALISGVGADRNAKRAALIHLYFNVIGTSIFMVIFYVMNMWYSPVFMDEPADAFGIALVHSVFNIATVLMLLPFSDVLVRLACCTVKGKAYPKGWIEGYPPNA